MFIQEKVFKNIVCEMAAILSRPHGAKAAPHKQLAVTQLPCAPGRLIFTR